MDVKKSQNMKREEDIGAIGVVGRIILRTIVNK
jgi:hypothetical protein